MLTSSEISTICTRTGGFLGLAAFLLYGLKAAFVYGGLIGIITAAVLTGGPVGAELTTRILVAGGMLLGVLAVGSLSTVLGAVLGTTFDAFVFKGLRRAARASATDGKARVPSKTSRAS